MYPACTLNVLCNIWFFFLFSGTVYLTLGNIPPKYRSTLNGIQLLAVTTYPIIKEYGIDALFEPIMNDLAHLEKVYNLHKVYRN